MMTVERRLHEASSLREFFHDQWQQLSRLIGAKVDSDQDDLSSAVDMMVAGTDSRVRAVSSYKKQLRDVTRSLLEHIDGVVNSLPKPMVLNKHSLVYDPQVSALFSSIQMVEDICWQSHDVREYAKQNQAGSSETFFALLFVNYSEKEVLGGELKGDIVQRDVKQTHAVFTGHRFMRAAVSEQDVRKGLKKLLFENVIKHLKCELAQRRKNDVVSSSVAVSSFNFETLNNPSRYLATLVELLKLPKQLVSMNNSTIRIDSMGVMVSESADAHAENISIQKLDVGNRNSSLIALAEIPWSRATWL